MWAKIFILSVSVFCILKSNALSLDKIGNKDSSEEKPNKVVLESLKEFIRVVDKYNLNVTAIGSRHKYGSGGWVKESLSLTMHMPVNDDFITTATLDDAKQDSYLKKLKAIGQKENVGAKVRVIKVENGEDKVEDEHVVNSQYLIDSPGYQWLTNFQNGQPGFGIKENGSHEILFNYIIRNPSEDKIKNIQIITALIEVNETDVSSDFPTDVLEDIKDVLPKLWLSNNDETILSRTLVNHLDKKFDGNFQAVTGVDKFALGGRQYANLQVADSNIVVFYLS